MKDFTWYIKAKRPDGTITEMNMGNVGRQSWFKTPQSCKKNMAQTINWCTLHGYEIIESYCYTRSGKHF